MYQYKLYLNIIFIVREATFLWVCYSFRITLNQDIPIYADCGSSKLTEIPFQLLFLPKYVVLIKESPDEINVTTSKADNPTTDTNAEETHEVCSGEEEFIEENKAGVVTSRFINIK